MARRTPIDAWMRCTIAGAMVSLLLGCAELGTYEGAYEVTVDFTAEGKRMQLKRRIFCEGKVHRYPFRANINYGATASSFGMRLPSGAAVVMVTPYLCQQMFGVGGGNTGDFPILKHFLPKFAWIDSADRPSRIEFYVSEDYFTRPNARIRYHGMTARIIETHLAKPGPVDEFFWLNARKDFDIVSAYYAVALTEDEWKKEASIAEYVRDLTELTIVPKDLPRLWELRRRGVTDRSGHSHWRVLGPPGPTPSNFWRETYNANVLNASRLMPLFRSGRRFEPRAGEQSYLVVNLPADTPYSTGTEQLFTFSVGGRSVDYKYRRFQGFTVYDPVSRLVYVIDDVSISLAEDGPTSRQGKR